MHFDCSGAELFLAYLSGNASLEQVLNHRAYQIVCQHSQRYSEGITEQDIQQAVLGRSTSFYGVDNLTGKLTSISALLEVIDRKASSWTDEALAALSSLFPAEDCSIPVYPIIGYDMGIGLNGAVCLNCACDTYQADPEEILFYTIHECVHVLYERHHDVAALRLVITPAQWRSYFHLWVQNEGYAVFAPLDLRMMSGHMGGRDYQVLRDRQQLKAHQAAFRDIVKRLDQDEGLTQQDYLDYCFGPMRLSYRIGCELVRRIGVVHGQQAVRDAFYWDGDRFFATYQHLLEGEF